MIAALLAGLLVAAAPLSESPARFALVVGNNDGGSEREVLRWAVRDAERVAAVLGELGGVPPERALLLREPSAPQLVAAIDQVAGALLRARAEGAAKTELIVYYSGHADSVGLLLGSERFAYARLRTALEAMPADVAVVVLDACGSGAMLRPKGGTPVAGFLDNGSMATGHAYLTSAASNEVAQESDRLQASFFTHHFVAALRGAADTSGDGRVTLVEAYQHAFAETLAGTAETLSGPQHPSYDIALSGQGDLVLTQLDAGGRLVVDATITGRVFVRDAHGRLAAEVTKSAEAAVTLALPPGPYTLATVVDRRVLATSITVGTLPVRITRAQLSDRGPALETRERGGTLLVDALPRAERSTPIRVSFVPLIGFEGGGDDLAVHGLAFALLADRVASVRGVQLASIYAEAGDVVGLQLAPVAAAGVVRGSQVGLVTYARKVEGVALSLFPWVVDGVHVVETWVDTLGHGPGWNLGYRLGPRHLHIAGSFGARPLGDGAWSTALGVALGTRVTLGLVTLDLDLGLRFPLDREDTELHTRALVGLPIAAGAAGFGVFAGGGLMGVASGHGEAFGLLGVRYDR